MLQVWTWGEPWGDFSMNVNRHPRPVPGATNIAKIACGAFHNLAFSWYTSSAQNTQSLIVVWTQRTRDPGLHSFDD